MVWKPKNQRSITVIKLTLWAGIVTWMAFFVAYGVIASRRVAIHGDTLFGDSMRGEAMTWMLAVLCVFAPALLCVAIARYVNKKIGRVR